MAMDLHELLHDIAIAIKIIDDRRPQASNARSGALYLPGIGPHPETQAVALVAAELGTLNPDRYGHHILANFPYLLRPARSVTLHRQRRRMGMVYRGEDAPTHGRQR